uniref:Polysaccharide biosynthesis domain-containing protein n=1 Tax=Naja naja TaxID=35670 RepID=A0A8C6VQQ4_NAJNA
MAAPTGPDALGAREAAEAAHALSLPAEAFGNDPRLEAAWAERAFQHAQVYFHLLSAADPAGLRLTRADDRIYAAFRRSFPDLRVDLLDVEALKSEPAKEVLRGGEGRGRRRVVGGAGVSPLPLLPRSGAPSACSSRGRWRTSTSAPSCASTAAAATRRRTPCWVSGGGSWEGGGPPGGARRDAPPASPSSSPQRRASSSWPSRSRATARAATEPCIAAPPLQKPCPTRPDPDERLAGPDESRARVSAARGWPGTGAKGGSALGSCPRRAFLPFAFVRVAAEGPPPLV